MRLKFLMLLLCLPFIGIAGTNNGSILLHNDTAVILTAVIQASDGSFLGQFTVQPGQQRNWTTNMIPTGYVRQGTPDISLTPYSVIWQCPSQAIFSMCTGVSPGAYVKATICEGRHFCSPKEEQKKDTAPPASTLKKSK